MLVFIQSIIIQCQWLRSSPHLHTLHESGLMQLQHEVSGTDTHTSSLFKGSPALTLGILIVS